MAAPLFISGIVIGLFLGAILWEVLVAGPEHLKARQREHRMNDRVRAWQRAWLVEYAQSSKVATAKAMFQATHRDEADTFARKVPDLKAVR